MYAVPMCGDRGGGIHLQLKWKSLSQNYLKQNLSSTLNRKYIEWYLPESLWPCLRFYIRRDGGSDSA